MKQDSQTVAQRADVVKASALLRHVGAFLKALFSDPDAANAEQGKAPKPRESVFQPPQY
jgi:hypothetical protein